MIIVKIRGGLGNQLFQYALGRNIAISNNATVKFDLSWFEQYTARKYKLDHFNIVSNIATAKEVKNLKRYQKKQGKLAFIHNLLIADNSIYIKQKQFNFDPNILKIKGPAYLDGHWQSEKYFKNIENIIRKEITLKNRPDDFYKQLEEEIGKVNSVSLHVRRGDYMIGKVQKILALCPLSYYYEAIEKISKNVKKRVFFVFSDDIKWVKKNLKTSFSTTFIGNNSEGSKNYEELILMSKCKHNIIANSSFSWWGSWLNNNPNKIVIAPQKWFKDISKNTKDLILESWKKL